MYRCHVKQLLLSIHNCHKLNILQIPFYPRHFPLSFSFNSHYRSVRTDVKTKIAETKAKFPHFKPHLAIVQVGTRDDSAVYIRMKERAAKEVNCRQQKEKDKLIN